MPVLTDAEARRGGSTASRWYETVHNIRANAASAAIRLTFSISGNKGGTTDVEVDVGPNDFPTILELMSNVNRQAAMEAMTVELARQVQTQPERDKLTKKAGRDQVQQMAYDIYIDKPAGEDDNERIVKNGVTAIVAELSKE